MKLLTGTDLNREDALCLEFRGTYDAKVRLEHALEPFLQVLEQYAGEWMPSLVKGKRRRTYSRAAFWKALQDKADDNVSTLYLERPTEPAVSLELTLFRAEAPGKLRVILLAQPFSFFAQEERCRELVELVRAWACHYPTSHAFAGSYADSLLADSPCFGRDMQTTVANGFDQLYEVFWLNVFGPKLVNLLGRERLLSTPAHRVEELPNGCVLLVTWPIAAHFSHPEARQAQARAFVHLRPELTLDTVLRSLHQRNTALVPVEPRFHPDVAPLLFRLLDNTFISERQRKIAEFNAHPFPEPEEWLPADAALPSDVPDTHKALEHLSLLAESLVAILHSEVPSVLQQTPESLTDADLDFWTWSFPERFERDQIDGRLVPAIGAYLGEVMVKHLGGQWIARKKLEESQVRVGSRVWLPFLRAHKSMRSCQSLLDFSLTQFYRAAERHRG
ncbi:hypothetical protein [Hyalangium minutum]|uniref:Uncharacterized protein n=1 Tax=Hyalangium minutum TaxID=394096 RepID=A0A085WT05_9BACT|nr:hypothetical protein [Hyalangium minutum]KFE70818.1 hypothetical protein DB31_5860 [Hyalangium minutum]